MHTIYIYVIYRYIKIFLFNIFILYQVPINQEIQVRHENKGEKHPAEAAEYGDVVSGDKRWERGFAGPNTGVRKIQWIGLRENLQESPIFNGKIYGFL
jgi:hypothetical protein